jgi:hypothetical protein
MSSGRWPKNSASTHARRSWRPWRAYCHGSRRGRSAELSGAHRYRPLTYGQASRECSTNSCALRLSILIRGAPPLGLPHTLSRAPLPPARSIRVARSRARSRRGWRLRPSDSLTRSLPPSPGLRRASARSFSQSARAVAYGAKAGARSLATQSVLCDRQDFFSL